MFKILIAEDDRELCRLFSNVLTRNGYSVKGVANGKEALDAIENDYYDVIISDIMMPGVDGFEFAAPLFDEPADWLALVAPPPPILPAA